jgi:NSS family neurotransmitter:Na+ symporter
VKQASSWRTRFGFYLLALGSAFSLGNLWRFPFVVGENGGGAFVLLYFFLCLLIGLPILICELIIGRTMGASIMKALHDLSKDSSLRWLSFWTKWTGRLSVLVCLVVLSYYSVISGWVLHYLTRFIVIWFHQDPELLSPQVLLDHGWLQFLLSSVHVLIVSFVVVKGIQEGLEKWISYLMPPFGVLVILLVVQTLSLPSNSDVLRFLFYPDFSKLTYSSLSHALGHVFFTLSVGFGTMVAFGSYLRSEEHLPTAGYRVSLVDALVSMVALLLVFPVAFQASANKAADPMLLFDVIPRFLFQMKGGGIFGILFFLCLYFAALNATLALFEGLVANVGEAFRSLGRTRATWLSGLLVVLLSVGPSLFSSPLSAGNFNHSLIEVMDGILVNWILPVIALGISVSFGWVVPEVIKQKNFIDPKRFVSQSMYSHWTFALKWVVPFVIILGLILQIVGALKGSGSVSISVSIPPS